MASDPTEAQILKALSRVGHDHWAEVLNFMMSLSARQTKGRPPGAASIRTSNDLLQSGLVGLWADRHEIADSCAYARELRRRAEQRRKAPDVPA
jgi:hypothetical protein